MELSSFTPKQQKTILGLDCIGLILTLIFSVTINVDELEHLRASWLISLGDIPYRDFWEHHHPLMWFLFAPLMKIIPENIYIATYLTRIICFIVSCGSTLIIYKMAKRFFGGKQNALLCLCLFFFYYPSWYMFSIFKPDTFMRFFYLLGLYNFFLYLEDKKLKNIMIADIAFTISFLFLQTIASIIIPLIIPLAIFLNKNRNEIKNVLLATVLPIIILFGAVYYLYATDSLTQYIQTNWVFNNIFLDLIQKVERKSTTIFTNYFLLIITGYGAYGYMVYKKQSNIFIHTTALLMTCDLLKNLYFSNILPHYLILIFLFDSLLIAPNIKYLPHYIIRYIRYTFYIMICLNFIFLYFYNNVSHFKILSSIEKEKTYILTNGSFINVFSPRYSYYWLYTVFEGIDNALFERLPDYNINNLIRQYNIPYISGEHFPWKEENIKTDYFPPSFRLDIYQNHMFDDAVLEHYEEIQPELWHLKKPFTEDEVLQN